MYEKLSMVTLGDVRHIVGRLLGEIKVFFVIFLISFLGMVVFTNADMFYEALFQEEVYVEKITENSTVKLNNLALGTVEQKHNQAVLKELDESIKEYEDTTFVIEKKDFDTSEEYLKETRRDQVFDFNVLPPTDRIVIPGVGLDVPLVDSKVNNIMDFTSADFDDDLMSGVVKYPTTPVPGTNGNTLLFGHTSQERWKNNDYSTVFNKLPQIKEGDIISVVWNGKLHDYKMVAKEIVYPKGVEAVYQKYQKVDEDYLTLMGCYPLGSAKKRILIMAKRVS